MVRRQCSKLTDQLTNRWMPDLLGCLRAMPIFLIIVLSAATSSAAMTDLSKSTKALFQAVQVNDMGAVKAAISSGADLAAHNTGGMTPADLAVDKGHFIIAHFLLSARSVRKTAPVQTARLKALDLSQKKQARITPQKPRKTKRKKFKLPPKKPRPLATPIAEEVAVMPAPGVDQPSGSAPPEVTKTDMPKSAGQMMGTGTDTELMAETDAAVSPQKPGETPKPVKNKLSSSVGDFFQSLVDLVVPDNPAKPSSVSKAAAPPTAKPVKQAEGTDNPDKHLARELEKEPAAPPSEAPKDDFADIAGIEETVEAIEDNTEQESQPERIKRASTASRTLDRIKNLISPDAPKEDEFGLPIIEEAGTSGAKAVDSILDQLSGDTQRGNLDDPPGPESGPPPEPILASEDLPQKALVSNALRQRLERLGDALSRDVYVDTKAILEAGRRRHAEPIPVKPLSGDPEKRSDIAAEKVMTARKRVSPRTTPATRFRERIESIRSKEDTAEETHGVSGTSAEPVTSTPATSTIDHVVDFFIGNTRPSPANRGQSLPGPTVPAYRNAPNAGTNVTAEGGAPDLIDMKALEQPDETRPLPGPEPVQTPGKLPPVFLDRLAGLFNEEGQNLEKGWTAKTSLGHDNNKDASSPPEPLEENPWTTTTKLNVGEGRAMATLKIALTKVPPEDMGEIEVIKDEAKTSDNKRSEITKMPYSDPLKAPGVRKEEKKKAFFSRLTQLFQPRDRDDLPRELLLLEQDEKLSTTHQALRSDVKVASRTTGDARTYWPITEMTKADQLPTPERRVKALSRTSLSGVSLNMGESVNLYNTFPPGNQGRDQRNQCVKKNRGTTLFCIEPIDWPEDLKSTFQIATLLYTGPMAIARFDQGSATRLHALYTSEDFERVTSYFQKHYGEPTEIWKRSIAPLAQPRQDNPTQSWRNRDPETNAVTILEVRKFDDTRGGFPDTKRGAVMLYYANSPTIFPQVSAHELMRLKRVAKATESEAELTPEQPAGAGVAEDELFGDEKEPTFEPAVDDSPNSALDELLQDTGDTNPDESLEELNSETLMNDPLDMLENLPDEQPVKNPGT